MTSLDSLWHTQIIRLFFHKHSDRNTHLMIDVEKQHLPTTRYADRREAASDLRELAMSRPTHDDFTQPLPATQYILPTDQRSTSCHLLSKATVM